MYHYKQKDYNAIKTNNLLIILVIITFIIAYAFAGNDEYNTNQINDKFYSESNTN